jgi:phosphoglycolate phosphatase-like HAD superfamily hydrolase
LPLTTLIFDLDGTIGDPSEGLSKRVDFALQINVHQPTDLPGLSL